MNGKQVQISLDLGPMIHLLLDPYETILDRLVKEGRISESERELFRQEVLAVHDRLEGDIVSIPDRYRSD